LISNNFYLCFGQECFASDAQVGKLIAISFGASRFSPTRREIYCLKSVVSTEWATMWFQTTSTAPGYDRFHLAMRFKKPGVLKFPVEMERVVEGIDV